MKCSIFAFFVFIGCVCGLQAPLHYKYKYFGSVSNGIPELNSKASGWAMKADINVYVLKDDGETVFQFRNIKMFEYAGDINCDFRGNRSDEFFIDIEDPSIKYAFETPFKAHLFHYEDFAIEYVGDEYGWLTNMRKGIVSVFRNEILKGNIENHINETVAKALNDGHIENVFSVNEETIFGICMAHYTFHPIPEHMAASRNKQLEELYEQDIQRKVSKSAAYTSKTSKQSSKSPLKSSKTSSKYQRVDIPDVKDDLWNVVRSIDFDKCEESVALQGGNTFETSDMNAGQHDWRRSHSSVSEYIFRGSGGHFRLEKAVIEGARTMAPYGYKTELLQTRVNQIFQLISVESAEAVPFPEGNLKHSKNWMYHFFSPGPTPKYAKNIPWVQYETDEGHIGDFQIYGLKGPSDEQVQKNMMELAEHLLTPLKEIIDSPTSGSTRSIGIAIPTFINAISLFREMTPEEILETFRFVDEKFGFLKKLVIDIAATSGPGEVYKAILEYAKEGKVAPFDVMTTFMLLTPNKQDPIVPEFMMDYVVSLDMKENPLTTPTILINFAYFFNKICSNPDAKNQFFYGPLHSKNTCPDDLVKAKFVPYLENIIFSDKDTWEKNVAILSLRQLGTAYSYQILTSVITEEKMKFPINTRVYAIESLDGRMFYKHNLRKPVMNLLTEIYTKVGEDISVREAALHMILSWGPESHFFYRLAKMSWRDPSRQFSSLATSVIDAMANLRIPEYHMHEQAASHALKFARPVAPSVKYNYFKIIASHFVDKRISITSAFDWLTSDKSSKLKNFYYGLFSNFGGFQGNQIEIDIETERLINMYETVMEAVFKEGEGKIEGIVIKIAEDFYSNIEEAVKSHIVTNDQIDPGDVYLSLFQHMKLFLPNFFSEAFFQSEFKDHKSEINFAKFITPIQIRTAYPTEVGLPVFMEIFESMLGIVVGESELKTEMDKNILRSSNNFQLDVRLSAEYHSMSGVLLPWSKLIADIHTMSVKEVHLPLKGTNYLGSNDKDKNHFHLRVDLESASNSMVQLFSAASISLATLKPVHPVLDRKAKTIMVIIDDEPQNIDRFDIPNKFTGLDLELNWQSDLEFPFSQHKIEDMFSDPSSFLEAPFMPLSFTTSSLKYWAFAVNFDPVTSNSKNISMEFSKGKFGNENLESLAQEVGEFSQYGEEGNGQFKQEQESAEDSDEKDDSEEHVTTDSYLVYGESNKKRDEKLQNIYGGPGDYKTLKISFDGDNHRSFEVLFAKAKSIHRNSRRLKKSGITFIRSPIPEVDSDPSLVCLNFETSLPSHKKMYNIEDYSSDDPLRKETKIELYLECTGEPVIDLEGKYTLSEAWASKLKKDLPKYCDYDSYNEMQTLESHLIYDDVKFELEWKNICNDKYPITTKAIKLLNELKERFSHNQCYTLDETHEMHVEIYRCPITGNWDIKVLQKNSAETFKQIPHNHVFSHLFSIGKKTALELHPEIHSLFNLESDNCVIGFDSVRTFDGYTYEYKPTQCWSVASKVCNKEKGPMLLVRSSDIESTIPEVKYIDVQRGIVVEYAHHEVKVNNKLIDPVDGKEIITDDYGHELLTVVKKDDFFMVKFEDHFYISANNKIVVHAPQSYAGTLCGMCGNFNGEPVDDLIGPHRCPYSDPNTFVASWTGKSDKCDSYSLLELREDAENYQTYCSTVEKIYESRPPISQQCYYPAKFVSKTEYNICISKNYLLFCKEGCEAVEHTEKEEVFLCWSTDNAPPSLKEVIFSEASLTDIDIEENYKYETTNPIIVPTVCRSGNS